MEMYKQTKRAVCSVNSLSISLSVRLELAYLEQKWPLIDLTKTDRAFTQSRGSLRYRTIFCIENTAVLSTTFLMLTTAHSSIVFTLGTSFLVRLSPS